MKGPILTVSLGRIGRMLCPTAALLLTACGRTTPDAAAPRKGFTTL